MTIKFIAQPESYGWMSNFWRCDVVDSEGTLWPSTEHLYQALKFGEPEIREQIRKAKTPKQAKELAHLDYGWSMSAWDSVKLQVMEEVLKLKFRPGSLFAEKLIATGDELIEEDAHWDNYWGTGPEGKGENHMGKLLMKIREQLKNDKA